MNKKGFLVGTILSVLIILGSSQIVAAEPTASLLAEGLEGASGSGIGPGGALYVTENTAGRITRIDPTTGEKTTFASGLPLPVFPIGGVVDVAFIGSNAYALVTMVGSDIGGSNLVGIYRVDGPNSFTVVADLGEFAIQNPSNSEVFIKTGVHYSLETFRGGLLVTDGHHNRVLSVTLDGEVSVVIETDNTVPTGLAVRGNTIYMAEAGPIPHLPDDGKVIAFDPDANSTIEVASGAPLLVDVEFGRGQKLYGLAQGPWDGVMPGSPALPDSGSLVEINNDGTFTNLVDGLDRPTSMEFLGNTAYIITLDGEVWMIDDVSEPPFGYSE